jgi:hypothetical protein
MKINYSIANDTPSEFKASLETATQLLDAEIGPSAGRVRADWDFFRDHLSRPCFKLKLLDSSYGGRLERDFNPFELAAIDRLKREFHSLWGDLLQESASVQRQKVERLLQEQLAEEANGKD